jgi:hypothetical protein
MQRRGIAPSCAVDSLWRDPFALARSIRLALEA